MKRKILGLLAVVAMCFTLLPANSVKAATVLTENKTGSQDGYDYELWKDNGNTSMTLNGGGKFSCQWSNINNALFRIGKKFDSTKTYQQLGNISVDYGCDYNPSGNSYLCVYGWTKSPLVEYYVVDSWGTWRPPGATSKGQITVDGGTYDVYETTRVNQPSIEGNTTFKQYWSVRTSKRTSGTISLSEHFKKWESMGLQMGKMYEAALTVEGYQSSGRANVYKNDITIGGPVKPDDPPIVSGEWKNTANVSWINPAKKLVALSFDDGPAGTSATRIQNALAENKMHATFFYWGNTISNTNEIRRAQELGFEVANHTYTHPYLTNMSASQIQDEIGRVNNVLKGISGKDVHLIRPPYLAVNDTVKRAVNAPMITCSVDCQDWNGASTQQIVSNVLNNIRDGSIVLMHETYDNTAAAVEQLIPQLISRGYVVVSVSELAKMKNITLQTGQVYTELLGNNITSEYIDPTHPDDPPIDPDDPEEQVITDVKTGSIDNFDYELWKDNGNTKMVLKGGGKFSCEWSNINNALFRIGKKFDATKTYQQLGNIKVDYGCEYNPNGNSYLCVYGWTKSPLIEYYVVDSWGTWRPPGATAIGQITVDGGTYDVYQTERINQPSIEGTSTFKQYWSVRTSKRTSGTISLSEHFKKWEGMGLQMGKMYEAALTVEGYQSSGSANVYKNDITIGGDIDPDDPPDDPPIDPDDPPVTSDVVDVTVDARESGNSINQIYEITAKTSAPVDLSKLTIKSYFTKADTKPMTCWVDCADINMNEAPWYKSFSAVSATVKSDSEGTYLEVKVNDDFNLAQGKGKVKLQLRLTNNDWSNVSGYKAGKTVVLYQ